mmetsp:Transcript_70390/g.139529  ORF Transcript_70390/g.139529 Transcript_70390/m.139529 type:complete len:231 (-) Transcript_70390:324-1016(-)
MLPPCLSISVLLSSRFSNPISVRSLRRESHSEALARSVAHASRLSPCLATTASTIVSSRKPMALRVDLTCGTPLRAFSGAVAGAEGWASTTILSVTTTTSSEVSTMDSASGLSLVLPAEATSLVATSLVATGSMVRVVVGVPSSIGTSLSAESPLSVAVIEVEASPSSVGSSASSSSASSAGRLDFIFSSSATAESTSTMVAGCDGSTTCTWHQTRCPHLRWQRGPVSRQ